MKYEVSFKKASLITVDLSQALRWSSILLNDTEQ